LEDSGRDANKASATQTDKRARASLTVHYFGDFTIYRGEGDGISSVRETHIKQEHVGVVHLAENLCIQYKKFGGEKNQFLLFKLRTAIFDVTNASHSDIDCRTVNSYREN